MSAEKTLMEIHVDRAISFFNQNGAKVYTAADPLVTALAEKFDELEDEKLKTWTWYEKNIIQLLRNLGFKESQCKGCGLDIWWAPMAKSGKLAPITQQALNHFADCPKARDFKK